MPLSHQLGGEFVRNNLYNKYTISIKKKKVVRRRSRGEEKRTKSDYPNLPPEIYNIKFRFTIKSNLQQIILVLQENYRVNFVNEGTLNRDKRKGEDQAPLRINMG